MVYKSAAYQPQHTGHDVTTQDRGDNAKSQGSREHPKADVSKEHLQIHFSLPTLICHSVDLVMSSSWCQFGQHTLLFKQAFNGLTISLHQGQYNIPNSFCRSCFHLKEEKKRRILCIFYKIGTVHGRSFSCNHTWVKTKIWMTRSYIWCSASQALLLKQHIKSQATSRIEEIYCFVAHQLQVGVFKWVLMQVNTWA